MNHSKGVLVEETTQPGPDASPKKLTVVIIAIAVIAIAALGVAGWMYYKTTSTQRAAIEQLEEATALVRGADEVVLALDAIVQAEVASVTTTQVAEVTDAVPGAADGLEQAIERIDACVEDLPESEIAYTRALRDAASSRLDMLAQADPILEANGKAAAALRSATDAWALVLEADELSRKAVAEYNKLTSESVTRSTELTKQSTAKTTEAKELFSQAATAFPEADFAPYLTYVDKKLAALALSKQADELFLGGKPAEANALGDKFNAAERELAALAAKLPASPAVPIAEAYESLAGKATKLYFQARAQATEADARLREVDGSS